MPNHPGLANCGGSRGRSDCGPRATSGVQPQHYRWIPADRLELRVAPLILVALLRKSPLNYGDLSTAQQTLALEKESK